MEAGFALHLFSTDPAIVREAASAGVDAFIVDWERIGKVDRQAGADTQVNEDSVEDLEVVRRSTTARVICRINELGPSTPREVEEAIGAGADEILLPMVRTCREVSDVLGLVRGRAGFGILVETVEAVGLARELARFPLRRVYVGLNDLAISRGTRNIFEAVADGTVETVRRESGSIPFGFGGLTHPDCGTPLPCRLLIGEMARLRTDFSFLRRSFFRDLRNHNLGAMVQEVRRAFEVALARPPRDVARDRDELLARISAMGS